MCFRPVVLLGAGRSGTTLLYKLLALHADVAYLSNFEARLPGLEHVALLQRIVRHRLPLKVAAWFKPDGGAYIGPAGRGLRALIPAPVEGEPVFSRFGLPLRAEPGQVPDPAACSALREHLAGVQRAAGGRVLLLKRTANNRRIPWFEAMDPAVRYIRIIRDGRAVAASLLKVDWWADHILFWSGKSPLQLEREGSDPVEVAARNWIEEETLLDTACAMVMPERLFTLRYEDLMSDPEGTLVSIFRFLDLSIDPAYLASVEALHLGPSESAPKTGWTRDQLRRVEQIQAPMLARFGYAATRLLP